MALNVAAPQSIDRIAAPQMHVSNCSAVGHGSDHGAFFLPDHGAAVYLAFGAHQTQAALCVFGAEDHSFAHHSGKFGRLQVGDDQDFLSDHLIRGVPLLNAGEDLAGTASDLHLAAQELS